MTRQGLTAQELNVLVLVCSGVKDPAQIAVRCASDALPAPGGDELEAVLRRLIERKLLTGIVFDGRVARMEPLPLAFTFIPPAPPPTAAPPPSANA